jgi:hypothetical protein
MFETMAAGMTTIEPVPMLLLPFLAKAMGAHIIPARAKNIDFQLIDDGNDKDLAVNMSMFFLRSNKSSSLSLLGLTASIFL